MRSSLPWLLAALMMLAITCAALASLPRYAQQQQHQHHPPQEPPHLGGDEDIVPLIPFDTTPEPGFDYYAARAALRLPFDAALRASPRDDAIVTPDYQAAGGAPAVGTQIGDEQPTIYVSVNGSNHYPCGNATNPCSYVAAFGQAVEGDVLVFNHGTYYIPETSLHMAVTYVPHSSILLIILDHRHPDPHHNPPLD